MYRIQKNKKSITSIKSIIFIIVFFYLGNIVIFVKKVNMAKQRFNWAVRYLYLSWYGEM